MKHRYRWFTATFVILTLLLSACGSGSSGEGKIEPSKLEPIEGSEYQRVVVTEKAAERLDIQTVPLREEPVVRKRTVGGEVVALPEADPGDPGPLWAYVAVSKGEADRLNSDQPTLVVALDDDEAEDRAWPAEPDEGPGLDDDEDFDLPGEDLAEELYYRIDGQDHGLEVGQAVLIEFTSSAGETLHKVVPYAAVLYGVHGETWVYSNPEPLVYVRQPIVVDFIEGDLAYLSEGPEVGTAVVTIGAAELFGVETGVSK
jgi:hypothetical protein